MSISSTEVLASSPRREGATVESPEREWTKICITALYDQGSLGLEMNWISGNSGTGSSSSGHTCPSAKASFLSLGCRTDAVLPLVVTGRGSSFPSSTSGHHYHWARATRDGSSDSDTSS